jgi:hypothetical protein
VTENNGKYSASLDTILPADTTVYPGVCFTNIPEGMYNITVAIPDNYNATTELSYTLEVNAGDRAFVPFGAQSQDVVADPGTEDDGSAGGTSTVLGIFGALLLLGGAGLGYYAWRTGKPDSKLSGGGILRK